MILCLDLETTGLDEQKCGLVEIGAVWLQGGEFYRKVRPWPDAQIEERALEVNGTSKDRLQDPARLPESMAIVEFIGWVRGGIPLEETVTIAAWNAHFDHRHLHAALTRAGVGHSFRPFTHRLLDLHSLTAGDVLRKVLTFPNQDFERSNLGYALPNSDAGSEYWGLEHEPKPHDALAGARQVRAMLRRFLGDTGALP